MLKRYSAACARITKWNLNMFMLVVVEKAIYQAQSLKKVILKESMCDNFRYSIEL